MIPDSGRSYLSKFYDDNWMLEHGFLERRAPVPTVEEVLRAKHGDEVPPSSRSGRTRRSVKAST